jgi:Predicted periplasmic protein
MNFNMTLGSLAFAAALSLTAPASANVNFGVRAAEPVIQTAAIMPLSMQYFCAKNRSECRGGGSSQVTMTPNLMALLKQVNVQVNRSIRPKREASDVWTINPTAGDCEDYVLTKRSALIRQGVSASALRIAFTHTRRGQPHAVLVVRTSEGDYVLDNLNNSVKTLRASGYSIRSMSTSDPTRWTAG